MDSNPPTTADFAYHDASEARNGVERLERQIATLVKAVSALGERVQRLESLRSLPVNPNATLDVTPETSEAVQLSERPEHTCGDFHLVSGEFMWATDEDRKAYEDGLRLQWERIDACPACVWLKGREFIGPCTCEHYQHEHGWGECLVVGCTCEAHWAGVREAGNMSGEAPNEPENPHAE